MKVIKQFKCDRSLWAAARAAALMKGVGIGPYIEGALERELGEGVKKGAEVRGVEGGQVEGEAETTGAERPGMGEFVQVREVPPVPVRGKKPRYVPGIGPGIGPMKKGLFGTNVEGGQREGAQITPTDASEGEDDPPWTEPERGLIADFKTDPEVAGEEAGGPYVPEEGW